MMVRILSLCLLLYLPFAPAAAQETSLEDLAAEFCQCMQAIGIRMPKQQADECLTSLANNHRSWIRETRKLNADNPAHRLRLAESLLDLLVLNCPYLQTLQAGVERERRWSDKPTSAPPADRYTSEKAPPAELPDALTAEAPREWKASGRLHQRISGGRLRLELDDGTVQIFVVRRGTLKGRKFSIGDPLHILYFREWRKEPQSEIINVLREVL